MRKRHIKIPYREEDHGDFDAEWPSHTKVTDWWFITGYLTEKDNPENLFSYQYTLLKPRVYGLTFYVLQMAFTDFQTKNHLFKQMVTLRKGKKLYVNQNNVNYLPFSILKKKKEHMELSMITDDFSLQLGLQKNKGAFWHADNGVLVMGLPHDTQQRTVYYTYPNMPTSGEVTLNTTANEKKILKVTGKSWCDHQWGPFRLLDPASHWEWFSLRFFDDEEIMLFAFPQHPYYDGTYINHLGERQLIRNYRYTPKEYIEIDNFTFSKGWELEIPNIKEERYEIRPLIDGQLNLAYFELMAEILNPKNERVGYCFAELLPGVRNPTKKISFWNLLKRI
ncbi:MAG: lipocalin-like domain-containing protein [Candidatus Heimdallarchaeota archaeon]